MDLTELETEMVRALLSDEDVSAERLPNVESKSLEVEDRSFSGKGFVTDLRDTVSARQFAKGVNLRWGAHAAALLNDDILAVLVVYVDDGRINGLEAATCGEDWPEEIHRIRIRRVENGKVVPENGEVLPPGM